LRKVCVVVASRANYGRIKTLLRAVRDHSDLELILIAGASAVLERYGHALKQMEQDGFVPDALVRMIVEGENPVTMAKSTGMGLLELPTLFELFDPDIVLTIADRFETLATAVSAAYMNIPLAHTQGGEITGSIDESVRHAITKFAHVHFPATQQSAERVIRLGERPETVFMTGCPSIDIVAETDMGTPDDLVTKPDSRGRPPLRPIDTDKPPIDPTKPYLLVMQHPVTTEYGLAGDQMLETLKALQIVGTQVVFLWPNVDAGSEDIVVAVRHSGIESRPDFVTARNFPPDTYVRILEHAAVAVGNSSSFLREGAYLGTPVVNVGSRQGGREHGGNVINVEHDAAKIADAIRYQFDHGPYPTDPIFGDGTAGKQIAEILSWVDLTVQKRITY
jgi:UDP-hydrolysing UDP-N-acetyl-D-glucosamine 2-epimerase